MIEENGHQISNFGTTAFRQGQTAQPRFDLYCSDFRQFVVPPVRKNPAGQVRLVRLLGRVTAQMVGFVPAGMLK
jgi:hypothetical protein